VPRSSLLLAYWSRLWVAASVCLFVPFFAVLSCSEVSRPQVKNETFKDGVEHWYYVEPADGGSYFERWFQDFYSVAFSKNAHPFGRSIAFLVGVGAYHSISPQLESSVRNDLIEMRALLMNEMGFDEVYIAKDDVVNRDLIEEYVKGKIANGASKYDRLLFYYTGHGGLLGSKGVNQGETGYMLFGAAQPGQFYGPQVLAVSTLKDWSRELKFQHMLFILDSCASGLAFTSKSALSDTLLETLSGNGSRTVITAGTAEEATYSLEDREHLGNGVFTYSLLKAFRSADLSKTALVTISDLFARVEKEMAEFRKNNRVATTPQMVRLDETDYRGTFVFLNARAETGRLPSDQAEALGVRTVAKQGDSVSVEKGAGAGIIEIFSTQGGLLAIDSQIVGNILRGETLTFRRQAPGPHQVILRAFPGEGSAGIVGQKDVTVESGGIVYAVFGADSPVDTSVNATVGTLILDATHGMGGDVSIDNFRLGLLQADGQMSVANLLAGPHRVQIDQGDRIIGYPVLIKANETEHIVLTPNPPNPPTGLTATVY
jgi:hypothetical protein